MSSLRQSYAAIANTRHSIFSRPVTLDGTALGARNMNVNGDVSPLFFYTEPEPNQILTIEKLSLALSDGGNPAYTDYGNVSGPLATGVKFYVEINGVKNFFNTILKQNSDLAEAGDSFAISNLAAGARIVTYSANYFEYSEGIKVDSQVAGRFGVQIADDLTTLLTHGVWVKGFTQLSLGA